MSRGRLYKVSVFDTSAWTPAGAANTGTTTLPVLYGVTSATQTLAISTIAVAVMGVGTIPSNASVTWSLNIVTGTKAGGNTASPQQKAGAVLAAQSTWSTAGGASAAAITGLTVGNSLWDRVTPYAAGANWEDIVTYGDEVMVPASTQFAVCVTPTAAGTSTTFFAEVEFSE
jgi:hypothetical protein